MAEAEREVNEVKDLIDPIFSDFDNMNLEQAKSATDKFIEVVTSQEMLDLHLKYHEKVTGNSIYSEINI